MKREIGDYIQDILQAMNAVLDFVKDITYETFSKDTKTIFAVARAIEVIGEAVKKYPQCFKEEIS